MGAPQVARLRAKLASGVDAVRGFFGAQPETDDTGKKIAELRVKSALDNTWRSDFLHL